MNLTDPKQLADLLQSHGFHTIKSLGQNFLICPKTVKEIVENANIKKGDTVVEIGPGPGVITEELLKTEAKKIIALELDSKIIPVLKKVTNNDKKLEIINISALKFIPQEKDYLLVANIPYFLTSPIMRHYLGNVNPPKRVVFLIQKEVAEKICAKEDSQSILSLEVGIYGKPSIINIVSKDKFFPAPKVNSAILKIEAFSKCLIPENLLEIFWKTVKTAFLQRRKKLSNSLGKMRVNEDKTYGDVLKEVNIDPDRRPQTLSIQEWLKITRCLNSYKK